MKNPFAARRVAHTLALAVLLGGALAAPLAIAQDAVRTPPAAAASESALAQAIDAALATHFKADEPGATVIVTREGKPVYRRAFGMGDLGNKTALKPDDALRIGSLTKQFTAVAILMLADRGKLALDDPIAKHLQDYPKVAEGVTVEHLLTHTSGIPSYTNSPDYLTLMAKAVTVDEMIARFKDQPLEFKPGTRWRYSNSGYFLLGAIIERVSGMPYAEFVAKEVFAPLGLNDTSYEGFERSTKRIVKGYSNGKDEAQPLHMSQPYAAGSLISTVDDLAKWDAAIAAGKLLKPATWKRAFTPYVLADGGKTTYGYGWSVRPINGMDAIMHSGGINGFVSHAVHIPGAKVYAAMLSNRMSGAPGGASPTYLTEKVAAIAAGKPFADHKAITLDAATLDRHIGVYMIDDKTTRTVTREGTQLYVQRTGGSKGPILAASANVFFLPNSFTTFTFEADAAGETTHLVVDQASGRDRSPRVSKMPPAAKKAIAMTAETFDRYVGVYTLVPGITMTVSREGEKFFTQVTRQGKVEIAPETETLFFAKEVDAQVRFERDTEGKVTRLVILQGGRETPGMRDSK
ncbi:MAG: serine hydrolase [Betaproteobacteria bacterium]|nr:serine hydrolase [Betaproteobacteria bacterium]